MPRQIWNEGRVVGYSAYEVYVKHAMSIDPDHEPATEKEWLASMMAMGSSMLLRIGTTEASYIDVEFPSDSRLCAANNIIASVFTGAGYVGTDVADTEHKWCTKVTDYGPLISNDAVFSPSGNYVPLSSTELSDTHKSYIREYMKIVDGIVLQPGTWTTNSNRPPQKDFTPTLAKVPTLRISFSEPITTPFFLLLTGFTNRSVVAGVTGFFDPQKAGDTGFGSAVNTQSPQDGDFLGPWAFPWAAKVIFSVPSAYINYFMNNKYSRQLKSGTPAIDVKSDAIIDMKQNYDGTASNYYETIDTDAPIEGNIKDIDISGEDAAILATYMHQSGGTKLPPALYGALVQTDGITKFIPIDTVAPGALKLYRNLYRDGKIDNAVVNKLKLLESAASGTTGFMRDDITETSTYVVSQLDQNDTVIPVSDDTTVNINNLMTVCSDWIYFFTHTADTGEFTSDNLKAVRTVIYEEIVSGYVSAELINTYGLTKAEHDALISSTQGYLRFYGGYWEGVSNTDDYVAFICGAADLTQVGPSADGPQLSFLLVNKYTGQISSMEHKDVVLNQWLPLDFTQGNVTATSYDTNLTDYLGTWWGKSGDVGIQGNTSKIVLPASRHPMLKNVADSYASEFYMPTAYTPYCSSMYSDFRYQFDATKFETFLNKFGMTEGEDRTVTIGDVSVAYTGWNIHKDFRGLSLQQMLKYSLTQNIKEANTADNRDISIAQTTRYYYTKAKLQAAASSKNFKQLYATLKINIPAPTQTMFDMRLWSVYSRTANNSNWSDITQAANRPDVPVYAAVGQSGHNSTTAISLVDNNNIRLNLSGTSKTIDCDTITWGDLLIALNMNQRLDLLAGATFRKDSEGVNYITTADGVRLYISKTPPTSARNGDIGIGW